MSALILTDEAKWLGIELFNKKGVIELLIKFIFNMLVIGIIVRFLYYPLTRRRDYLFTYLVISAIIFMICFLLSNVKLQMGFALGLLAIFRIIRYRTSAIPIKEISYLLIVIGVSVINALANKKISYAELFITNFLIIAIVFCLEKIWLSPHEFCKLITYEKIELINAGKYDELLSDLQERTGLKINRIEIGEINFLRDSAIISVYYFSAENRVNLTEERALLRASYDDDDD